MSVEYERIGTRLDVEHVGADPKAGDMLLSCYTSDECGLAHVVRVHERLFHHLYAHLYRPRPAHDRLLTDKLGALTSENTDLLAENARLRRRLEDVERKLAAATRKKGPYER